MASSNIMAVFEQNPDLKPQARFKLLKEVDAVVEELSEILSGVWLKKATNGQVEFLEEVCYSNEESI